MVDAYADGCPVFLAYTEEATEALVQTGKFLSVFLVGIFQVLELSGWIYVVAGVDADFLDNGCGNVCHIGVEVYVGAEGNM